MSDFLKLILSIVCLSVVLAALPLVLTLRKAAPDKKTASFSESNFGDRPYDEIRGEFLGSTHNQYDIGPASTNRPRMRSVYVSTLGATNVALATNYTGTIQVGTNFYKLKDLLK